MGSLGALFDSTILIDYLNGIQDARVEIGSHAKGFVSIMAWMEVMVKADGPTEVETRSFLERFTLLPLTAGIAEEAVLLRRGKLKMPDAIIYATSQVHGLTLVTRNTRDFNEGMPGVRIPYRL